MTIEELIEIANQGYPDDIVSRSLIAYKGKYRMRELSKMGDTLGTFIAMELIETFDETATSDQQFAEAIRVMITARDEIQSVIDELMNA